MARGGNPKAAGDLGREYHYKDGNRDHWRLTVEKDGEHPADSDPEGVDFRWGYTLSRLEDGEYRAVFRETFFGQYDERPRVSDLLADAACRFVRLAVEFTDGGGRAIKSGEMLDGDPNAGVDVRGR